MITLERAIALAAEAHAGVFDRGNQPYILHPLRVMLAQDTDDARVVAVFHDVLEDVPGWDADRLREEGFTEPLIRALEALTKRPEEKGSDEGYMRLVARAGADPIARSVKLADLRDNLDESRLAVVDGAAEARMRKYRVALGYLNSPAA